MSRSHRIKGAMRLCRRFRCSTGERSFCRRRLWPQPFSFTFTRSFLNFLKERRKTKQRGHHTTLNLTYSVSGWAAGEMSAWNVTSWRNRTRTETSEDMKRCPAARDRKVEELAECLQAIRQDGEPWSCSTVSRKTNLTRAAKCEKYFYTCRADIWPLLHRCRGSINFHTIHKRRVCWNFTFLYKTDETAPWKK